MSKPRKIFKDTTHSIAGRILLLEDDQLHGEWLGQGLARRSLETHWTQNLEEALELLRDSANSAEKFHAIVTDVFMADSARGGLELMKKAEELDIPTVIISSKPDLDMAKEAIRHGANDFLVKPFEISDLVERLRKTWEEPRYLSSLLEHFLEIHKMTEKEKEVSRLLFKGLSNKEIAEILQVTEKTVKFHVTGIFEKAGVKSRSELVSTVFPT